MKEKIHPTYGKVLYACVTCGNQFVSRSTKIDGTKREHEGVEYPSIALELCSKCHPFFSGKQMLLDTAGRVEKFNRRYAGLAGKQKEAKPADEPAAVAAEAQP
jgi:large subunit ribosomal protein L31